MFLSDYTNIYIVPIYLRYVRTLFQDSIVLYITLLASLR